MSSKPLPDFATLNIPTLAKAAAGAFAVGAVVVALSKRRSRLQLPPGPPPKPLLGNLLDLPPADSAPWLKWSEWADQYGANILHFPLARLLANRGPLPYSGDVVHLEALGQHIVILSSHEACEELLVKRGAIYSDRPICTMANL